MKNFIESIWIYLALVTPKSLAYYIGLRLYNEVYEQEIIQHDSSAVRVIQAARKSAKL